MGDQGTPTNGVDCMGCGKPLAWKARRDWQTWKGIKPEDRPTIHQHGPFHSRRCFRIWEIRRIHAGEAGHIYDVPVTAPVLLVYKKTMKVFAKNRVEATNQARRTAAHELNMGVRKGWRPHESEHPDWFKQEGNYDSASVQVLNVRNA